MVGWMFHQPLNLLKFSLHPLIHGLNLTPQFVHPFLPIMKSFMGFDGAGLCLVFIFFLYGTCDIQFSSISLSYSSMFVITYPFELGIGLFYFLSFSWLMTGLPINALIYFFHVCGFIPVYLYLLFISITTHFIRQLQHIPSGHFLNDLLSCIIFPVVIKSEGSILFIIQLDKLKGCHILIP